jgi:hypothetical protein
MGSMSASDAAPLPRLGEVYFDVRGESRSMRLSWYADTGVAVFSIWQGGTCTGTFRLPIADLPRMIEALQRGPHGAAPDQAGPLDASRGATEPHGGPAPGRTATQDRPGYDPDGYPDGYEPDRDLGHGPDLGHSDRGVPVTGAHRGSDTGDYGRPAGHGTYEQEHTAAYPGPGSPSAPGGYRAEGGAAYEDEPTGVYRGDPLSADYREDTGAGYRDVAQRSYRDDPLGGGYREAAGGYGDDPLGGSYREGPRGGHGADSRGDYRDHDLGGGYPDDPDGGYADGPGSRYADGPGGGYADGPRGGYQEDPLGGGYRDGPHTSGYRGDPLGAGYRDNPDTGDYDLGPRTARFRADPGSGDYPAGPPESAIDSRDYPASAGDAGYSPVRPYVAPVPGSGRGTGEGRRRPRGRAAGREESDPSPDSFPYGDPAEEPEARGRRR